MKIKNQTLLFWLGIICWFLSAIVWTFHQDGGYLAGAGLIFILIAILGGK